MSLLSDLYIPILPSRDFRRLIWVLTGVAYVCLWYANLSWWLNLGLGMYLTKPLFKCSSPYPTLKFLAFNQQKWTLNFQTKKESYSQLQISADTGFFILCRFSDKQSKQKRWLVIFYDQITQEARRSLYILQKTPK